MQLSLQ